jgi:hypothetical protein
LSFSKARPLAGVNTRANNIGKNKRVFGIGYP